MYAQSLILIQITKVESRVTSLGFKSKKTINIFRDLARQMNRITLLGFISFSILQTVALATITKQIFYESHTHKDVTWTSDVILDVTATSPVNCMMTCAQLDGCLTLTFDQGSRKCQGYSEIMTNADGPNTNFIVS